MGTRVARRTLAARVLLVVPIVVAAAMFARFFDGFWLGDDFPNLHQSWILAQRGELLAQSWAQLAAAVPSQGAFYRPLMMASLSLNQWLAGDRFAGWFAFNFAVHLANAGMVGMLVVVLAAACGREGRVAGALAASFFAVCPLLAEGVFWVSARADACVTLLTLAGLFFWASSRSAAKAGLGLPLLLLVALGFKESAAVLPLQMLVVALLWPRPPTRGQKAAALAASFAAVTLFLGFRAYLFGNPWHVYPAGEATAPTTMLWQGVRSLDAWWHGLGRATPVMADVYLAIGMATLMVATASAKSAARKLAVAMAIASGGLAAATLINLGSLVPSGEGGRLAYAPVAWLALALGVALSRPMNGATDSGVHPRVRTAGMLLLAATVATGAWVLEGELRGAHSTQRDVRALAAAIPVWADQHPGLTLLVIAERSGPVIATRNAQGGLALPPVQPRALLHRVLPTLPSEIELRHDRLAAGLATRLEKVRPATIDPAVLQRLREPDTPRWPEQYACWDAGAGRIVKLETPDPEERPHWSAMLRREIARCRL